MGAVWYRFRAELHARWKSWLGLALMVGLVGGIVLGALAGARRTDSAYPKFLESQRAYDVLVVSGRPPLFDFAKFDLDEIAALPNVADAAHIQAVPFFGRTSDGAAVDVTNTVSLVASDGRYGREMNRLHMLEGRAPRAPDEIAPSFLAAETFGLEVGDTIDAGFFNAEQVDAFFDDPNGGFDFDHVSRGRIRVVGIEASPGEFPPLGGGAGNTPFIHFAPSFADSPLFAPVLELLAVRVHGGAVGVEAFKAELERRSGGRPLYVRSQAQVATTTRRSMNVQADALRIVALLAAITGLLVVGQLLVRQGRLDDSDQPVLRALGMGPTGLLGVTLARVALIGVAGAATAVLVAAALSPLTPVGIARKAETDPGLALDALVLGIGAAAVVLAVLVVAIPTAWWALRRSRPASPDEAPGSTRPSRAAEAMARAGMTPAAVSGVRFALVPGRGRTAAPVRATIVGVALGIAAITAVSGFTASLDHLLDTPRLFGSTWDAQVGDPFSPEFAVDVGKELAQRPDVGGVAAATRFQVEVGGERVDAIGSDAIKGGLGPVILEGRRPDRAGEIAFGSETLRDAGYELGDRVTVRVGDRAVRMRIVGRVVVPDLGDSGGLGQGAALTLEGARRLTPNAAANIMLVRAASPGDRAGLLRVLDKKYGEFLGVTTPRAPDDLASIRKVDSMPFVIGGMMVVVSVATIVHGLVTSVRRRRRDLAVLRTLGMRRGQVSSVVAWQATTIAVIALVIGLPIGILVGQLAWSLFSAQLGTLTETVISVPALLVMVPVVVLVANLAAAAPGRMAARIPAALALRSE